MEVIYYMRNYYPLTAAQKMHHNWILDYGTQQVSGVSVVASVQAETGFWIIKKNVFRWKQSVPVVPESVLQSRIKMEM